MKNDTIKESGRGDTLVRGLAEADRHGDLGRRLVEMECRGGMPAGLDEKIMAGVRREARRLRRVSVAWSLLAGVAGGVILLLAAYAALSFADIGGGIGTGISDEFNAGGILSAAARIFKNTAEGFAVFATPMGQAAGFALLIGTFYLSINGAINSHTKRKTLEKEYRLR